MLKRPESPTYREKVEAVKRHPDVRLRMALYFFATTENPYWAWVAIDVCSKSKMPFPELLRQYLAKCATFMLSDEAKSVGDLRAVLPAALSFNTKRGQRSLLDPQGSRPPVADHFALKFAIYIERGETPSVALKKACEILKNDDVDEKTLRRWLLEHFEQPKWLKTNAAWKKVALAYYKDVFSQFEDLYLQIAT